MWESHVLISRLFPGIGFTIIKITRVVRLFYVYNGNFYTDKKALFIETALKLPWGNIDIFPSLISSLHCNGVHSWNLCSWKTYTYLSQTVNAFNQGQYHGCWCPGGVKSKVCSLHHQDISSHSIDLGLPASAPEGFKILVSCTMPVTHKQNINLWQYMWKSI